jgi:hypothetical protein
MRGFVLFTTAAGGAGLFVVGVLMLLSGSDAFTAGAVAMAGVATMAGPVCADTGR